MKLFIAMCALLMLGGCLSTTPPRVEYQANQLQPCPDELPIIEGNTGADLTLALTQWGVIYHSCKDSHNSLITAIRKSQNDNTNK